jgi:hypothetical protein
LRHIVKPSDSARISLDEKIATRFVDAYLCLFKYAKYDSIDHKTMHRLLVDAGIKPAPGSDTQFFAELVPEPPPAPRAPVDLERLRASLSTVAARFDKPPVDVAVAKLRALWDVPKPSQALAPKAPRVAAADRALRVGGRDVTRLKTGLATLDAATRGGILLRKLAVFGGAPGAGKTALLVKLAYQWLSEGIAVAILAADEDADATLIRLGQQHGLSRDALENGNPTARAALAAWCKAVPLILVDGDEDNSTIEAVSRELRVKAGKGSSAMIVDPIQTARSEVAVRP